MEGSADLILLRMPLAENWRRRGKFEEVAFIFPNAPTIPITAVRASPLAVWWLGANRFRK